ncbi:MAG: prepilin-type N-terminal cleavage/methylation domain-containing protein [Bdellovibrionaceae bacterium]|nr:prepilin-type N-terminal cleavage/methylation domain-containing protein [Pseudobdellovibrionaceae bacterium]
MRRTQAAGFSLIEVLIALGLMSLLAYATTQLFANQISLHGFVQQSFHFDSLRDEIGDLLTAEANCRKNFLGTNVGSPIPVAQLKDAAGETRYETLAVNPDASYSGIQLQELVLENFVPVEPGNIWNNRGHAELRIMGNGVGGSAGPRQMMRKLRMYVEVLSMDPANSNFKKLASCSARPLAAGVDSITDICVTKRSASTIKDSIAWCPDSNPLLFGCAGIDDSAPSSPYEYTARCLTDGLCHTGSSGGTPIPERRLGAGSQYLHAERVVKSGPTHDIEGCLVYDHDHGHLAYRIDIYCCR